MHIIFWNIYLKYLHFDDCHAKVQKHPEQMLCLWKLKFCHYVSPGNFYQEKKSFVISHQDKLFELIS